MPMPRKGGNMITYDQLIQQARRSEVLQDEATMEPAVKAVLGIIANRLDEVPARLFASELPKPLTYEVLCGGPANVTDLSVEQYFDAIANQFHMPRQHGERLVSTILQVVCHNLSPEAMRAVRNNLPQDWNRLLQKVGPREAVQ